MFKKLPLTLYILSLILYGLGILFHVMDWPGEQWVWIFSILSTISFTAFCLSEVFNSKRLTAKGKVLWVFGFIFINPLVPLIYFCFVRKQTLNPPITSA